MNNADYWARRLKTTEEAILNDAYKNVQDIEQVCKVAITDCDTLIRAWHQRLAANNNLSYAGARKLLTLDELEEFHWTVREYIKKGKENAISGEWAKQLENASARRHISQYESIKLQLQHRVELISKARDTVTTEAAKRAYIDSYYHTAFEIQRGFGVGYSFQSIDESMLDKILARPWTADGQTFSGRIWNDRNKLVDNIQQELTRLLVAGTTTPDKAISAIAARLDTTRENAGRLVMTESAYFSSVGQRDCYKELDVEQYQVVGTLDSGMCEKCAELDGKIFSLSEHQPGLTANPFHPWCRCCTAPYFADLEGIGERYARDVETGEAFSVPKDMTYKQWKAMQDEKYGTGTVDKKRKMRYNSSADEKQYQRYKDVLKELAPKSIEEFQEIKYSDSAKWNTLKYQYRTVNRYEVDGEVSVQTILDLDEAAWYTKQKGFDYSGFNSKRRKKLRNDISNGGNAASMLYDGNIYFSHSKFGVESSFEHSLYKGEYQAVTLAIDRQFSVKDLGDGIPRQFDTEAKFLEFVASQKKTDDTFAITILSEKHICESCQGVVDQFKHKFHNSTVNIISGKRGYNGDEKVLKTWRHRKKVK